MMDITDKNIIHFSDTGILEMLGNFAKQQRIDQNKSQNQLAEEAGISRSTLVEFEQGKRSNTLTLIQILRALNMLESLSVFNYQKQISPLLLAKAEQKTRLRASKKLRPNLQKHLSEW